MKPPPGKVPAAGEEKVKALGSFADIIFRKGQIGDWKNYLDEEKWKKIDEIVATKLTYKKPFKFEPSK